MRDKRGINAYMYAMLNRHYCIAVYLQSIHKDCVTKTRTSLWGNDMIGGKQKEGYVAEKKVNRKENNRSLFPKVQGLTDNKSDKIVCHQEELNRSSDFRHSGGSCLSRPDLMFDKNCHKKEDIPEEIADPRFCTQDIINDRNVQNQKETFFRELNQIGNPKKYYALPSSGANTVLSECKAKDCMNRVDKEEIATCRKIKNTNYEDYTFSAVSYTSKKSTVRRESISIDFCQYTDGYDDDITRTGTRQEGREYDEVTLQTTLEVESKPRGTFCRLESNHSRFSSGMKLLPKRGQSSTHYRQTIPRQFFQKKTVSMPQSQIDGFDSRLKLPPINTSENKVSLQKVCRYSYSLGDQDF